MLTQTMLKSAGLLCITSCLTSIAWAGSSDITFEQGVYYQTPSGEPVLVEPGSYTLELAEEWLRFIPDQRRNAILVQASSFEHTESIAEPTALSAPGGEADLHSVMLLLPEGRGIEAVGSYSGVVSRGVKRKFSGHQALQRALALRRAMTKQQTVRRRPAPTRHPSRAGIAPRTHANPADPTRVAVYSINLMVRDNQAPSEYATRLHNFVDTLVAVQQRYTLMPLHANTLLGINEAYAVRTSRWDGWNTRWDPRPVPCSRSGSVLTMTCLDRLFQDQVKTLYHSHQYGEIGVLAPEYGTKNPDGFQLLPHMDHDQVGKLSNLKGFVQWKADRIGTKWYHTLRREVMGGRFLIPSEGYILPFYSTHISTGKTSDGNRTKQLKGLVKAVKGWWRPGDLPPVVVGDFNSEDYTDKHWDILFKDFTKAVSRERHPERLEHIWIGKPSSFPGSIGPLTIHRYEYLGEFYNLTTLSDHSVPYAELALPEDRCESFDPRRLQVQRMGSLIIVLRDARGKSYMIFSGSQMREAERTLAILRAFSINQLCVVGSKAKAQDGDPPGKLFTYALRSGAAPRGSQRGEDCVSFNRNNVQVVHRNNAWTISDGRQSLMDFGASEGVAYRAKHVIQRYGLTKQCFVGRPNPSFTYWKQ